MSLFSLLFPETSKISEFRTASSLWSFRWHSSQVLSDKAFTLQWGRCIDELDQMTVIAKHLFDFRGLEFRHFAYNFLDNWLLDLLPQRIAKCFLNPSWFGIVALSVGSSLQRGVQRGCSPSARVQPFQSLQSFLCWALDFFDFDVEAIRVFEPAYFHWNVLREKFGFETRFLHLQTNVINDLVIFDSPLLDFFNALLYVVMLLLQTFRLDHFKLLLTVAH